MWQHAGDCWVSAMAPKTKEKGGFKAVEVTRFPAVCGGLLKKPLVLDTKTVTVDGRDMEFVQLKKGEPWLVGAVVGPMDRSSGLKRTKIVDDVFAAAIAAHGPGKV